MNILWITNIVFPEAERILTGSGDLKASGGWMLGMADSLLSNVDGIKLTVASVSPKVEKLTKIQGEKIIYYLLPYGKGNLQRNSEYDPFWKKVNEDVNPDVVHIFGTEFSHGLSYVNTCGASHVVVSIQGMTSAYQYYYYYGITKLQILKNITLYDIIKGNVIKGKNNFKKRGEYEIDLLGKIKYVIGRTSWDRTHTWAINPKANYFFCNEILRTEFYKNSVWEYERCDKHTIFLSQAGYPIKGLHQLLLALPLVQRYFPDTKVRVAGADIIAHSNFKEFIRYSGYGRLLSSLIKKYKLEKHVQFVGKLSAKEMIKEYLKCNVFVCPSSIENSPNSLGEAQILGVPVVASYVGGIPDMMEGDEEHLYRFEEYIMLADKICDIFSKVPETEKMRKTALSRHDRKSIIEDLMSIYNIVL